MLAVSVSGCMPCLFLAGMCQCRVAVWAMFVARSTGHALLCCGLQPSNPKPFVCCRCACLMLLLSCLAVPGNTLCEEIVGILRLRLRLRLRTRALTALCAYAYVYAYADG
jgi:hypothetical protein